MLNAHPGWRRGIAAAVASAAVLGGASLTDVEPAQKPEIYAASVVNTGGPGGASQSGVVHVIIERWSTEAERQALVRAYDQKGPKGMLAALQETERLGTLRTPSSLGWDLHYAVQVPAENGGRRIIVGTDRRVSDWDLGRDAKATDYPFTLVELRLDKDGRGEGRMSLATKIRRSKDGKSIELEHYAADPVRLEGVRKQKD